MSFGDIFGDLHSVRSINSVNWNPICCSRNPHGHHVGHVQKNKMQPTNPNAVTIFRETNYLNILVHFSLVVELVHCRLWKVEGRGVQSVERKETGVLSGKCSV